MEAASENITLIDKKSNRWEKKVLRFFTGIYDVYKFVIRFFKEVFVQPYEFKELVKQGDYIGWKSLAIITLTAFITGIVFTKQSRP